MKSPKPATDNQFKKLIKSYLEFLWYCVSQFENGDRQKFFNVRNPFRTLKSNNVEFVRYCGSILKMATDRNFSMSGIKSGHHNLPTYQMALKSDNVEFVRYCRGHFENGDRQKLFNVGNQFGTLLSTHISNFDDIRQC